jgi:hypothetical protein
MTARPPSTLAPSSTRIGLIGRRVLVSTRLVEKTRCRQLPVTPDRYHAYAETEQRPGPELNVVSIAIPTITQR